MGGGLESRCVGRVYGADVAVRDAHHQDHFQSQMPVLRVRVPYSLVCVYVLTNGTEGRHVSETYAHH